MRGSRVFGALLLAVWLTVAVLAVRIGADESGSLSAPREVRTLHP